MKQKIKNIMFIVLVVAIILFIVVSYIVTLIKVNKYGRGTNFSELYGDTIQEKVWWALKDLGYSDIAVAGAMGNLAHESQFKTNNLQDTFEGKLGCTDESYTKAIDSGSYSLEEFISDHAGYGLVQWTAQERKEGLYKFAKSRNVSISDENMQIEYLVGELTPGGGADGFASYELCKGQGYTVDDWKNATSIETAARAFCGVFEKGSWTSSRSQNTQKYYDQFHGKSRPSNSSGGGNLSASGTSGIKGTYKSSSGKRYTLYVQDIQSSPWYSKDGCFHCSLATIMSGFGSTDTPNKLSGFSYGSGCYGNRNDVSRVGCVCETVSSSAAKSALQKGDPILFHVVGGTITTDNGSTTHPGHWLVMLDYKRENGKDRVYIHDPWSTHKDWGWGDLDVVNRGIVEWRHIYKK